MPLFSTMTWSYKKNLFDISNTVQLFAHFSYVLIFLDRVSLYDLDFLELVMVWKSWQLSGLSLQSERITGVRHYTQWITSLYFDDAGHWPNDLRGKSSITEPYFQPQKMMCKDQVCPGILLWSYEIIHRS